MLPRVSCRAPGRPAGVLASVFAVLSLGACDKVPLLAPTASLITIVTSRSVLPIDGTAQIIATVIEQSGTPAHNGTLVTFTTTLGTLEPLEAVTSNGQAVVTLRAGTQSGTASILAFSGSTRTETLTTSRAATVTATAGTRTAIVAVDVNDAPTMTVTPTTTSPTVGQATTFTVAVTPGRTGSRAPPSISATGHRCRSGR